MRGRPKNIYGKLAAQAVEHYVKSGEYLPLNNIQSHEMARQRACYVSIYEQPGKRLRWFGGTAMPQKPNLAQEIVSNTLAAVSKGSATRLNRAVLSHLTYSVALLGPLQRIGDVNHLDPENNGLYLVSDQGKSAILLPKRAGVETADDQVATAVREAGVNPRQEAVTMYRFDVEYFDD